MVVRPVRHALEYFLAPRPRHLARRPIRLHGKTSARAHVVIQPKQIQFKPIHRALRELRVVCDSRSSVVVVVVVVSLSISRPRRSRSASRAPRAVRNPTNRRDEIRAARRRAPSPSGHSRATAGSFLSIIIYRSSTHRARVVSPRALVALVVSPRVGPRAPRQSPSRVLNLNIRALVPVFAPSRRRAPNRPETPVRRAPRAVAARARPRARPSSTSH